MEILSADINRDLQSNQKIRCTSYTYREFHINPHSMSYIDWLLTPFYYNIQVDKKKYSTLQKLK